MPRKHRPLRPREPKACQACAHAKVRCEVGSRETCERCSRLNKECIMQAPGAHKRVGHGQKALDVARLEEKLDSMAAVFTATRTPLSEKPDGELSKYSLSGGLQTDDEEARSLLDTFRTEMTPYFPFIAIPLSTTVAELQRMKPFLLSTIIMVACVSDADRQLAMARKIREYVGASIITNGEKSVDLLQGLLVCLAWYHFQLELGSQINNFLHLAWAMVVDLGLNGKPSSIATVHPDGVWKDPAEQSLHRTLDERRVYLGCFYLSATASTCLRGLDPMRYTNYTEECCCVLEASEEPADLYLIRLVRLHHLAERINRTISLDEYNTPGVPSKPVAERIKSLGADLQHCNPSSIPGNLYDSILRLHFLSLELGLYSTALDDGFSRYDGHQSERLTLLSSCLTATTEFLDVFFSIPTRNYLNLPYPIYAAYFHAAGTLSKLLLFSGEGWDLQYFGNVPDLESVVGTFISRIEKSSTSRHEKQSFRFPEAFVRLTPHLRAIEDFHKARRAAQADRRTEVQPFESSDSVAQDDARDAMFQLPHGFSWRFLRPG
ncbi:uncharacterized protein BJX67DRAFT_360252 [Aspergillus lucknowensis]|uniref:Zn(2)-C6 fungal-type domain-containing protein n=1 Tax=Aspergillus lucknowensis TaxID=176173 RepID=A0ABR4LJR2_9EURO